MILGCAVLLVLGPVSRWHGFVACWHRTRPEGDSGLALWILPGRLVLQFNEYHPNYACMPPVSELECCLLVPFAWDSDETLGGKGILACLAHPVPNTRLGYIPLWFLFLLFALAAKWLSGDRSRPPSGHCGCGYDLTANTTGRCPECGTGCTPQ